MKHVFFCIDGHTAGNPVRLVAGGAPLLRGDTMADKRQDFLKRFDWIRTGLCFECWIGKPGTFSINFQPRMF